MAKRKVVLSTEPGTTSKMKVAKKRPRKKVSEAKKALPSDSITCCPAPQSPPEKPSAKDLLGSLDEAEMGEIQAEKTPPSTPKGGAGSGVPGGPAEHAGIVWINCRFVRNVAGKPPELLREELKNELLGVHRFETTPAVVNRGYDFRRNLGNFTTAQVSVHVSLPCYVEDLDACDEYAQQWCESRMVREHNEMDAVMGNGARKEAPPEF